MELETALFRGRADRSLPSTVFVRIRPPPHRPRDQYRLRLREPGDVAAIRRRGLRAFLLTAEVPTRLHYPMVFPPVLFADRRLVGLTDSAFRLVPFRSVELLPDPPFEALVAMMLQVDEIAARVLLVRNPRFDPAMLARLIIGERLERPATLLRFQQFAPAIPVVGPRMPIAALREQDRKNPG